jgi:hypothetical protein
MNRILLLPLLALSILSPSIHASDSLKPIVLVKDGKSPCTIVVPQGESEKALEAATLLQTTLKQSTGVSVPITREMPAVDSPQIVVASSPSLPDPTTADSKALFLNNQQWWSVKRNDNQVWLTGNNAGMRFGTRSAVVTFLEDVVGARFFHFGRNGQVIPANNTVIFEAADKTVIPDTGYRALYPYHQGKIDITSPDCTYERWTRWNHLPGVPVQHMHIMESIAPPEKYFAAHPEYYSEIRGVRTVSDPAGWQLCTSNPDVVALTVEHVKKFFNERPDQAVASISMNDSSTFCDCEQCRIVGGKDPVTSNARKAIVFANDVAVLLEKTHPTKKVAFYAYHSLVNPPNDLKCHQNVIVVLADSHACAMHPLGDPSCGLATDSLNRLRQWSAISQNVVLYDYMGLTAEVTGVPHVNLERLSKNARLLKAMGVANITFDAMYVPGAMGLQYYAAVRLAVDSQLEPNAILQDYCDKLYGAASMTMQEYYRQIEKATTGAGVHSTWVTWTLSGPLFVWKNELFESLRLLLSKAASQVEADSVFRSNIADQERVIDLNFKYVESVKAQRSFWSSPSESANQFYMKARRSYLLALKQLEKDNLISIGDHVLKETVPDPLIPVSETKTLKVIKNRSNFSNDFASELDTVKIPPEAKAAWLVDDENFWAHPTTNVKAFADSAFLYFIVQSHTPETALLNGQSPTTDPQKSLNESVMVSLADAKDLSTRWNFTVTPKGKLEVEKNGVAITSTESLAVVKMQNAVGNRNWNVYLRVPRAYFPTSGEAGEYRVNFQRFRPDAEIQKVQSWSPTFGKPGEEQFMGFLTVKEK